jgi:hypothetical protein
VVNTGYGYFVLKLRLAPAGDPPTCAGVVERLGTAERRSFETADELLRLLGAWASDSTKMS